MNGARMGSFVLIAMRTCLKLRRIVDISVVLLTTAKESFSNQNMLAEIWLRLVRIVCSAVHSKKRVNRVISSLVVSLSMQKGQQYIFIVPILPSTDQKEGIPSFSGVTGTVTKKVRIRHLSVKSVY